MLFVCSSKGNIISFVVPRDPLSEAFWSPASIWAGLESYDLEHMSVYSIYMISMMKRGKLASGSDVNVAQSCPAL